MTKIRTFERFRDKALKKPGVREEYDALGPAFEMKRQMIALRKAAGLSQEQMAELLGTQKSNISRLESLTTDVSPRLSTVEQYAKALGYRVKVDFEPHVR
ncbi:MAG TPA: helix-turn-helix transcriptional regulator [Gammaproteobacteria bacterium]|nr:helix-turn-helix transcriptional regulator [Gammaproteobacteria bacterium]